MGGSCCTTRDRGGPLDDPAIILPLDKRIAFQREILKSIDKEKLHSEVLE